MNFIVQVKTISICTKKRPNKLLKAQWVERLSQGLPFGTRRLDPVRKSLPAPRVGALAPYPSLVLQFIVSCPGPSHLAQSIRSPNSQASGRELLGPWSWSQSFDLSVILGYLKEGYLMLNKVQRKSRIVQSGSYPQQSYPLVGYLVLH